MIALLLLTHYSFVPGKLLATLYTNVNQAVIPSRQHKHFSQLSPTHEGQALKNPLVCSPLHI